MISLRRVFWSILCLCWWSPTLAAAKEDGSEIICNCNGFSTQCVFNKELYERTGHGGHCINCTQNRDGHNCERCKENYYQRRDSYCISCDCNPTGSRSLQCNSEGKCQCKPGVTGDKCDRCAPNYFQFTNQGCKPCLCSEAGSLGNTPHCDPETGVCRCKENVEGKRCKECRPGYFNLDIENEFGCTPCFCYGHSSSCQSAIGYSKIVLESTFARNSERWIAEDIYGRTMGLRYNGHNRNIAVSSPSRETIYFVAPKQYLGDQRASYNHFMSFTFHINETVAHTTSADVILEGSNIKVEIPIHGQGNRIPNTQKYEYKFRLHEKSTYEWSPNLRPQEFMTLLSNVTSIRIRATYSNLGVGLLENFKLETALRGAAGLPALWIEMCSCPRGFIGQFCESCDSGFRHSLATQGAFSPCVPCDCNKHAKSCDSDTGYCICEHNTAGANCELCAKGYYGNALIGTANDCKECPCPKKGACIQMMDSIVCTECPTGYSGSRCEGCSDGYFGDPNGKYGPKTQCKLCECNHNIDMNAVANCNQTTGECLKCIYNTAGPNCDQCLPGYFGDALATNKGDCSPCECYRTGTWLDEFGIMKCNSISGKCECKPNVHGWNCDKCQNGFYNIASGEGCEPCNCNSEGSFNNTCDIITGQCHCRPGITGLQCDQCEPEHYGFSNKGCKECMCDPIGSNGLQCDSLGQCPCFENVEGQRCDMCKENKYDRQNGCKNCEPCYDLVQDAVNEHREKLHKLEQMLIDIEKSPTVISDSEFDINLATVKEKINDIQKRTNDITGNEGETIIQTLQDFNKKLDEINNKLKAINESTENSLEFVENSSNIIKNADEIIGNSMKEVDSALDYLQNDGSNALAKAQNRSDQVGIQSTQMSKIAQESRLIAEKLEKEANNINATAMSALNTAKEANRLAKNGVNQQLNISSELRNMEVEMNAAESKVRDIEDRTKVLLENVQKTYNKSEELYVNVKALQIPKADDILNKNEAEELMFQAVKTKQKINDLMDEYANTLSNVEDQVDSSQKLLDRSEELETEIQETLAKLDEYRSTAENAKKSVDTKYSEANSTLQTLKQFQYKVQTSREEADAALKKIPYINDTINGISETEENLDKAEENAANAKQLAEMAHSLYAKNASEKAEVVLKALIEAFQSAKGLSDEANKLPSRMNVTEEKIDEAEKKNEERTKLTTDAKVKVKQVKIDVMQAEKAVNKSLNEVTSIIQQLNNLPDLNEKDLDTLARRIEDAEMEVKSKNLSKQIKELQDIRNNHQRWLREYENEVKKLEAEVENVKEIAEALPSNCFKNVAIEI